MALPNAYAKYNNSKILTASPAELTLMLYDGAIKFCNIAIMGIEQKDINKAHTNIVKVQRIIEEFRSTLDRNYAVAEDFEATVSDLEYVKEKGELIIGITDYAPMNYLDENGNWTGFDTEFAEAVCEKLGVKATFLEIEWDNKFLSLESKVIDCIWNGMTISEEVLANTSCSKAYVKNAQVLVAPKDKAEAYKDPWS